MEEIKKLKKGKRKLVEAIDESASFAKIKKKKHKSKERKLKAKENGLEFQTQSEILESELNPKKDKKKKKKKLMPVKVDTVVASNKVTEEEKKNTGKKRKKSKKMIETMTDQQTANTTIDIDNINENSGPEALKSENRKVKKHKKKSKNVSDDNKIKNSKTKTKHDGEETSTAEQHEQKHLVDSNTASSNCKLKKKRRKKVLTEETATPVCLQKDLTTVDFNKDEESKIVPVNDQKNQTCAFGQWSSVQFGDSDRQTKFLRLMGGKKSSDNKKTGLWSGKNTFSKAAMNVSQAKQLENRLEGQFQNALEFNLQKRTEKNMTKGLGFEEDPAKGKKFHIDVNKINSIKFD